MRLPVPNRVRERLAPLTERGQTFLRNWEWTWTSAVLVSMGIAIVTLLFTVIIPSWWLYLADQTLRWRTFWLLKLRDAIAAGIIVVSFATILGVAFLLQQTRNKLRGGGAEHRTGGYR